MKKRMFLVVVILSLFIAIGAIELLSKEGGFFVRCYCFNEPAAIDDCIAKCTQRDSVCRGVCALVCKCMDTYYCDCKYIYFCNDSSYGYGYVLKYCPQNCPGDL